MSIIFFENNDVVIPAILWLGTIKNTFGLPSVIPANDRPE